MNKEIFMNRQIVNGEVKLFSEIKQQGQLKTQRLAKFILEEEETSESNQQYERESSNPIVISLSQQITFQT